jgi:putative thioredoxin
MTQSPHVQTVTQDNFSVAVLERSQAVPVLVDFWAAWCGPCQMLTPVLARLADEYQGKFHLAKVNTDEEQALAVQYGVRSLPTVKVFKAGRIVDEFMGAQPESAVRQTIERHIERPADPLLREARAALEAQQLDKALNLLAEAGKLEPDNAQIGIEQARALTLSGQVEDAENALKALPMDVQMGADVKILLAQIGFAKVADQSPVTTELEARLAQNPADLAARYQLSARKVLTGDYEPALDHLFEIMRRDRAFKDDAGRKGLLAIFDLLGGRGDLVTRYRTKMFNALH